MPVGHSTPEFFDDDIHLLLLGSAATPTGLYGLNNTSQNLKHVELPRKIMAIC